MEAAPETFFLVLLGVLLGSGVVLAWHISEQQHRRLPPLEPPVPTGVAAVLGVLRSSALVINEKDEVLKASAPAFALGVVRGTEVTLPQLADLVRQVRRDGRIRETELVLAQEPSPRHVLARVAPLSSRLVLALLDDRTRERRVDAIRRDFVANVSHELKTPVGALNLLAEAVSAASEDPAAVQRFAGRMRKESERLSRLVQQIIELSRLQEDDPLETPQRVPVDVVVERAVDQSMIDAQVKGIEVRHAGETGLEILGNLDLVALAVGNLVANAVAYSPEHSRIVVATRSTAERVEISVTDQGIGIPAHEIDRIFERFYRVDPARHRSTGGTGLGLSIVKHVAASHGGSVQVWSVEGQGSSFTLALPRATAEESARQLSAAQPRTDEETEEMAL